MAQHDSDDTIRDSSFEMADDVNWAPCCLLPENQVSRSCAQQVAAFSPNVSVLAFSQIVHSVCITPFLFLPSFLLGSTCFASGAGLKGRRPNRIPAP